jgi:copper chaperone NosL
MSAQPSVPPPLGPVTNHVAPTHRHLRLVDSPAPYDRRRVLVTGLALGAIGLLVGSLWQTWWMFKLYAPQYPHGLTLGISLTGLSGDVREIDTLNHYIGMGHLDAAASFERRMAGVGVAAVGTLVVAFALLTGRKLTALILVPAVMLPLGFVVDSFIWLYRFGHELDPHAPLRIPPFTPELFGNGEIGQFMTFAIPQRGFWMTIAAVGLLAVATLLRGRVCASCSRAGTCGALCKTGFIVQPPTANRTGTGAD